MTENTVHETSAPGEPRQWTLRHIIPVGQEDEPENSDQQVLAQATAALRDRIRDDGFVLASESIQRSEPWPIRLTPDGGYTPWDGVGQPDGMMSEWSATATERGTDDPDLLPSGEADDEGRVWFTVPAEIAADGGEVRLRHSLGGEVTVYAYDGSEDAAKMGYLIAVEVDDDVVSVALLPGTAALSVEPDPDEDESDG